MYKTLISSIKRNFRLSTTLSKVDKGVLLTVPSPRYAEIISQHQHLKDVMMDDVDTKQELPIHVILGGKRVCEAEDKLSAESGESG